MNSYVDPFDIPELSDEEAAQLAAKWKEEGRRRHLEETVPVAEAATLLGTGAHQVKADIAAGRLWTLSQSGEERVPRWQLVKTGNSGGSAPYRRLPHLTEVLKAMPATLSGGSGAMMHGWMTTPHDETLVDCEPVSAVEWLAGGRDPAPVIEALTDFDWTL
ncbi:hypothetical protein AS850_00320 [Frondihabitans sp. 762G35]|uniref:hypothetical protein n=1 Tax=Frondihabitans sp. 762G35 TaxID=1446794 RepID=UPI000D2080D6|nr:hypothetical protein [Frondihabitans sp. 762G35]ARC55519.1 hypothetical protein AS850_00320 [Frondihabitans sp. 762G35]